MKRIYSDKRDRGETYLTRIHHRETPIRIMDRRCDAGVVWYTEAYFHARLAGHPTVLVTIPDEHNHVVTYTAAVLRTAPQGGGAFSALPARSGCPEDLCSLWVLAAATNEPLSRVGGGGVSSS